MTLGVWYVIHRHNRSFYIGGSGHLVVVMGNDRKRARVHKLIFKLLILSLGYQEKQKQKSKESAAF